MARPRRSDPRQRKLSLGVPLGDALSGIMVRAAFSEVARLIGLDEAEAPFLKEVYERRINDPECYRSFGIPKKSGGTRVIEAPYKALRLVQKYIHRNFLTPRVPPSPICHSFVGTRYDPMRAYGRRWLSGRSIVSNAYAHLGVPADMEPNPHDNTIHWRVPQALFSIDIQHAYPSVSEERIRGVYRSFCHDPWTPLILATLSSWQGQLPQGAPSSPLILNAVFGKLDAVLENEFNHGVFRVTRYVDDIVLTSTLKTISEQRRRRLIGIVEDYGFRVNIGKLCYWQNYKHVLRVTGINLKPKERRASLPPAALERLRATFYRAACFLDRVRTDLEGTRGQTARHALAKMEARALARIRGTVGFCYMVYGEDLPPRLWNWSREIRMRERLTDLSLSAILETVKRDPPVEEIRKAMSAAAGY